MSGNKSMVPPAAHSKKAARPVCVSYHTAHGLCTPLRRTCKRPTPPLQQVQDSGSEAFSQGGRDQPLRRAGCAAHPLRGRACHPYRKTGPAIRLRAHRPFGRLAGFRPMRYSPIGTGFPLMNTAVTSPETPITSPRQSTMSASFPTSIEPTRSAMPMCSAALIVIARSAS